MWSGTLGVVDRTRAALAAVLVVLVGVVLALDLPRPTILVVRNRSEVSLHHVMLWGEGFRETIPRVGRDETVMLRVEPRIDSGLGVAFLSRGSRHAMHRAESFGPQPGETLYVDIERGARIRVASRAGD